MRRRELCVGAGLALAAGCLRLEESAGTDDSRPETEHGDNTSEGEQNGGNGDSRQVEGEVELAERWENDSIRGLTAHEGSFIGVTHGDRRLEQFDADTGDTVWRSDPVDGEYRLAVGTGEMIATTPDSVFVGALGGDDASVYAYDADTGDQQWMHQTDSQLRQLTAADGTLNYGFITDSDEEITAVRALDADTGRQLWEETFDSDSGSFTGLTVHGDRLYVGKMFSLHVFDVGSGDRVDHREFGIAAGGFNRGDDVLYLGYEELQAYDLTTDELRWEVEPRRSYEGTSTYADGVFYGGTRSGWVIARDADDGELLWDTRIDGSAAWGRSGVATSDGVLWVRNSDDTVHGIDTHTHEVFDEREDVRTLAATGRHVFLNDRMYELTAREQ